jgi:hypothetical protein
MPCKPNLAVWRALLGACRIHVNVEMRECIAKCFLEVDAGNAAALVMPSNIYAASGSWNLQENVHNSRGRKEV